MNEHEYCAIEEYLAKAEDEAETDADRMFLKIAGFMHPKVIYDYLINVHPKYVEARKKAVLEEENKATNVPDDEANCYN